MTKANKKRAEAQARMLVPLIPQLMVGFRGLLDDARGEPSPAGRPSPRHLAMLMSLTAIGPGSVSDLAARLNLTLTHTSQIVGELAESGLVERSEDPNDRRRTIVSVDPGRSDVVDTVVTSASGPLMPFFLSLPKEEADEFIDHLALLISFLTQSRAEFQERLPQP
jgi:DNA-binding MarR family transcriptional regulator